MATKNNSPLRASSSSRRQRTSSALRMPLLPLALLVIALCSSVVQAWVPPKPGTDVAKNWEPVDAMRSRLGMEFNFTPALLHPEICRYLTQHECQHADQSMQEHAASHRALQDARRSNPNLGKFKVLVLLIVFEDHVDRPRIDKSDVELMWNTLVPEWFDVNSYGNYDIDPVVTEWVVTDGKEKYYGFDKNGIVPEFQKAAWPALDALDNQAGWDWSIFDKDQDGKLDSVVITHSGYGAETVETDEYGTPYTDRIWAHAFAESGSDSWTSKDGSVKLNGYTVASALEDDSGVVPATIGLTVHEYMHTFGVKDLYDTTDPSLGSGIGGFDIMANPYGPNGNANFPGHLTTWSKMEVEWVSPTVIDSDGVYTLKPLETSNECYQIVLLEFGGFKEHLLLENRQKLEFDVHLYGAGLAIFHIDDLADGQKLRGFPGQSGWPENGNHYQVAMLGGDGNYDLEQNNNRGDSGDLWQPGQELGPGQGGTVFPNTDLYQSGWVSESGITIKVLEGDGENVKFEVSGLGGGNGDGAAPTTDSPTAAPAGTPSIAPTGQSSVSPTAADSPASTGQPSKIPTVSPSESQTQTPTVAPGQPTHTPSVSPTLGPTSSPTLTPSEVGKETTSPSAPSTPNAVVGATKAPSRPTSAVTKPPSRPTSAVTKPPSRPSVTNEVLTGDEGLTTDEDEGISLAKPRPQVFEAVTSMTVPRPWNDSAAATGMSSTLSFLWHSLIGSTSLFVLMAIF